MKHVSSPRDPKTHSGTTTLLKALLLTAALLPIVAACSSRQDSPRPSGEYDLDFDNPSSTKSEESYLPNSDEEAELLRQGMDNYDKELYTLARESFTKLAQEYPGGYYAAFAELKAADSEYFLERYPEALVAYEEFLKVHPGHAAAPYAMLQIANSHRAQYKGERQDQTPLLTGIKHYRLLIERFPQSDYARTAQRHIKSSRELLAEHERLVASFYFSQGLLEASANRLNQLRKHYPETRAAAESKALISQFSAEKPEFAQLLEKTAPAKTESEPVEEEFMPTPSSPTLAAVPSTTVSSSLASYRITASETVETEGEHAVLEPQGEQATFTEQPTAEPEQAPVEPEFPLALSCDERAGLFVFTSEFSSLPRIAKSEDKAAPSGLTTTVVEITAEKQSPSTTSTTPLQCEVGKSAAVLTQSNNGARLVLTYPAEHSRRLMVLDRPYRLIGIIKPNNARP